MSLYVASRITKPPHFKLGPLRKGRGSRKPYVIGFDSEAEHSYPFTLQFSLPELAEQQTLIIYVPRKRHAGLHAFMEVVHRVCTSRKREYLMYGFNLSYEFTQLFHDFEAAAKDSDDFYFDYTMPDGSDYRVDVYKGKRYFATIKNQSTHVRLRLLDAHAFFSTTLAGAAAMLGIPPKLDPPLFRRQDWQRPQFQEYARRDAYITRLLGERIVEMHESYDVPTCISAPHFACSVFRRRFLAREIPQPIERIEQYGLTSYHGGKNGYYADGPTEFDTINAYDIRSAYPEAMRALPNVETATFDAVGHYVPNTHSIWRATLDYSPCTYRGIQWPDGSWIERQGRITVHATGYELDAMLERNECRIIRAVGYIMRGDSGGPLVEYVDRFYTMKQETSDDTTRVTAKLFLNSLYGKFFQKVPLGLAGSYEWTTGNYVASVLEQLADFEAGGLYHPAIASLITGFVRAKIHRLEHKYDAVMTSTDGIFATREPDPSDIGTGLGALDVVRGRLRIWRERLYIFDSEAGKRKAALHGFRGKVDDLERVPLARGRFEYEAQQVVTLGMSTRRLAGKQYEPGSFVTLPFGLEV